MLKTDKTYCRPTKIDELGRIENWDSTRREVVLEAAATEFLYRPRPGKTRRVEWFSPVQIPLNRATVIEGPAGAGKTYLASFFAAQATQGQTDASGQNPVPPGTVLYYCRERDRYDSVEPHLLTLHGDPNRVIFRSHIDRFSKHEDHLGQRSYQFPDDLNLLEHDLRTINDAKLVIIDSLRSFAPTPRLMRESLAVLDDLAAKYRIPIVVLIQAPVRYDRDGQLKNDHRPWDDGAKYVWCLGPDPYQPGLLRFEHKRSAFSPLSPGVEMRIQEDGTLAFEPLRPRQTLMQKAMAWLVDRLKNGSVYAEQMLEEGQAHGFSGSLLFRAREQLGITSDRRSTPDGGYGRWWWTLPPRPSAIPEPHTHLLHDNPKLADAVARMKGQFDPKTNIHRFLERQEFWTQQGLLGPLTESGFRERDRANSDPRAGHRAQFRNPPDHPRDRSLKPRAATTGIRMPVIWPPETPATGQSGPESPQPTASPTTPVDDPAPQPSDSCNEPTETSHPDPVSLAATTQHEPVPMHEATESAMAADSASSAPPAVTPPSAAPRSVTPEPETPRTKTTADSPRTARPANPVPPLAIPAFATLPCNKLTREQKDLLRNQAQWESLLNALGDGDYDDYDDDEKNEDQDDEAADEAADEDGDDDQDDGDADDDENLNESDRQRNRLLNKLCDQIILQLLGDGPH
ncbi:MAG: AAA family ATPase [Planctomycetes bacterium]|nr:AAA family ATPase [Planctomycetota bacterium]